MTPDDRLHGAVRVLQGAGGVDTERSTVSRAAIVRTVRRRRRARRSVGLAAAALSVCLVGSTVWGAVTGRLSFSRGWHGAVSSPTPLRPVSWPVHTVFAAPHMGATSAVPSVTPVTREPFSAAPLESTPMVRAHVRSPVVSPVPVPEPSRVAALPVTAAAPAVGAVAAVDPAEALFRAAQHADFEAHDTVAALAAWEAYLRADPGGRFAPEATYNRALDLVRLGRGHEAMGALRPFAEGVYGSYRRREASQLIDALGSRESSSRP